MVAYDEDLAGCEEEVGELRELVRREHFIAVDLSYEKNGFYHNQINCDVCRKLAVWFPREEE